MVRQEASSGGKGVGAGPKTLVGRVYDDGGGGRGTGPALAARRDLNPPSESDARTRQGPVMMGPVEGLRRTPHFRRLKAERCDRHHGR